MQYEYDFPPLLFLLKIHCQEIVKHKCTFHPFFSWNKTSVFHVPALISVISVTYVVVKHGTAFKEAQPNDVVLRQFFLIFRDGTRFNFRWLMTHAVSRYERRNHGFMILPHHYVMNTHDMLRFGEGEPVPCMQTVTWTRGPHHWYRSVPHCTHVNWDGTKSGSKDHIYTLHPSFSSHSHSFA